MWRKHQVGDGTKSPSYSNSEVCVLENGYTSIKVVYITLPRKTPKFIIHLPVLRTNTRGQGEYPKASELTIVKELGKLIP